MCKRDTSNGSICCKCCTPVVQYSVLSAVGVVILVASFVIAAVILSLLQDGINNTVRYNSPSTDSTAYNDWLSSVPSLRSTNDAAFKYYAYYVFNITNLDTIVAVGLSGSSSPAKVIPAVTEVGPYVYRNFQNRLNPTFSSDQSTLTFQTYSWYVFVPEYSISGGVQLSDTTDMFYQPSSVYSAIFGNSLQTQFYGLPEFIFRAGTASSMPYAYLSFLNTSIYIGAGLVALPNNNPFGALQTHFHTWVSNQIAIPGVTSMKVAFSLLAPKFGGGVLNSPDWEYYLYLNQSGLVGPGDARFISVTDATNMLNPANMAGNFNVAGHSCADLRPITTGSALCWLDQASLTAIGQTVTVLTATQIGSISGYYYWQITKTWDFIFSMMGHQGYRYAPFFAHTCQPFPDVSAVYNNASCPLFNNANMWVKRSAVSVLFEDNDLLGVILNGATPGVARPLHTGYFKNATGVAQALGDLNIDQIGTGINHIGDVDNVYLFKGTPYLPTVGTGSVWCHKTTDPVYAPAGLYQIQNFKYLGQSTTFQQVTQAQSTKYSPNYPPGRVSDTNKYSLENSVIGDTSFQPEIFVSDIVRHATMVYRNGISLNGIDLNRYAIADNLYGPIPFFGQYHQGLANYTCPANGGPNLFACLPRYGASNAGQGKLNATELALSGFDLATLTTPSDTQFAQDGFAGQLFFDPTQLEPFLDLEPISGAAMSGSLKMQLNIIVQPWSGTPKAMYDAFGPGAFQIRTTGPRQATLIPTVWLNKIGFLSSKQASSFKSLVYGTKTASFVIVIVGTIVGGILAVVGLACVVKAKRNGGNYETATSKSDLAL